MNQIKFDQHDVVSRFFLGQRSEHMRAASKQKLMCEKVPTLDTTHLQHRTNCGSHSRKKLNFDPSLTL